MPPKSKPNRLNRPNLFSLAYPKSIPLNPPHNPHSIRRVESVIIVEKPQSQPNATEPPKPLVQAATESKPWMVLPPPDAKPDTGFLTALHVQHPIVAPIAPNNNTTTTCTFRLHDAYYVIEFMRLLHHELLLDTQVWSEKQMIATFPQFFHLHGFEHDMNTLYLLRGSNVAHRITNLEFMQYVVRHMYSGSYTLVYALIELVYYKRATQEPWLSVLAHTKASLVLIQYMLGIRRDMRAYLDRRWQSDVVKIQCAKVMKRLNTQMGVFPAVLTADRKLYVGTEYIIPDVPLLTHTHFQEFSLYHFLYADSMLKPVTDKGTTYDTKTAFQTMIAQAAILPVDTTLEQLQKKLYDPRNYTILILSISLTMFYYCRTLLLSRVNTEMMYDRLNKLIRVNTARLVHLLTLLN